MSDIEDNRFFFIVVSGYLSDQSLSTVTDLPSESDMSAKPQQQYLSDVEVAQRLGALSGGDCWRLEQSARIYADGTGWTASDLLQEAFVAALGRRQWRADLDARTFLIGAMRSLAFSRRKAQRVDALDAALKETCDPPDDVLNAIADRWGDPASANAQADAEQDLYGRLEALFHRDPQVLSVVRGRALEKEAWEIRDALGVTESQYETICRRLLRGYHKHIEAERHD